ncbi:MAG: winged helix-turn-helix domain-containing protein, partial [Myxococcota bacterium]
MTHDHGSAVDLGPTLPLTGFTVDLRTGAVVSEAGGSEALTGRERALLGYLARHPGREIPRDELLTEVWGYSNQVVSRAIDSTVRRLREKIELDPAQPRHLLTVWGTGYRFEPVRAEPIARPPEPGPPAPGRVRVLGERRIDLDLGTVRGPDGESQLTTGERALLDTLAEADGAVVDTEQLARTLWGRGRSGAERALSSVIYRIRRKIEPDPDA